MKHKILILVAALVGLPTLALAQNAPTGAMVLEKGKDGIRGTETITVEGAITAIDPTSRRVTIKGGAGNEVSMVAGPEVKNFAQLKVGDLVTLNFIESLTLQLKKGGKDLVERVESSDTVTAKPGELPMGGVAKTVHIVADVIAVDPATGVVTLRGPQRTVDLKVKDKEILAQIAVGDQVDAEFVEAVLISVSAKPPADSAK